MGMANIIVFPDQASFEAGHGVFGDSAIKCDVLETPLFCRDLMAPALVTIGNIKTVAGTLSQRGISVSGILPFYPFKKAVPEAAPPDPRWREIIGGIRVGSVKPSITDSLKLKVELLPGKALADLIPVMARLIRGGAHHPAGPVLAFEEEHRLLCFSPESIVILRTDDLLDIWITLRTTVDFICSAWDYRLSIEPERRPRHGIGAIEIFKHLPGTNCGKCGAMRCMEFATGLLTGRSQVDWCLPLAEDAGLERREALLWLLRAIGLDWGAQRLNAAGIVQTNDQASISGG
jgi:ArsR family metal-binding transcriptional regulator